MRSDHRVFWCLWLCRTKAAPAVPRVVSEEIAQLLTFYLKCEGKEWRSGVHHLVYKKGPQGTSQYVI